VGRQSPGRGQQPQEAVHALLPVGLHEDGWKRSGERRRRPPARPVRTLSLSLPTYLSVQSPIHKIVLGGEGDNNNSF